MGEMPSPTGGVTPWALIKAYADNLDSDTKQRMAAKQSYDEDMRRADLSMALKVPPESAGTTPVDTAIDTPPTSKSSFEEGASPVGYDPAIGSPKWQLPVEKVPEQYRGTVIEAAKKYNLPPILLASMYNQESRFNPNARSPVGASGIAQFMPGTAKDEGVDPRNPVSSIHGGARYLARNVQKYDGNIALGLMAYNWGSGNVDKWINRGMDPNKMPAETRNYVKAITGMPIEQWTRRGTKQKAMPTQPPKEQRAEVSPTSTDDVESKAQFASNADNRYSWLDV